MWKTLACLVGAMTGASVLLGWMDPSRQLAGSQPSPGEIERLARMVVGLDSGIDLQEGRWDDIEVVTPPGPIAGGSMLAAGKATTVYHFHIDRRGRPIRTQRWRAQAAVDGLPHTVRIQVTPPLGTRPASPAQCSCIRALVAALNEALAPGGPSLPVRLPQGWEPVIDIGRAPGDLASSLAHLAD